MLESKKKKDQHQYQSTHYIILFFSLELPWRCSRSSHSARLSDFPLSLSPPSHFNSQQPLPLPTFNSAPTTSFIENKPNVLAIMYSTRVCKDVRIQKGSTCTLIPTLHREAFYRTASIQPVCINAKHLNICLAETIIMRRCGARCWSTVLILKLRYLFCTKTYMEAW